MSTTAPSTQQAEVNHSARFAERLNWLRAGVLGANDGIVSVAATVVGVAAATNTVTPVLIAGVAAVLAGALSMALGEYVSVSSASDSQRSVIRKLRRELKHDPAAAKLALRDAYLSQGLTPTTAELVAAELTEKNPIASHLTTRFHLAEDEVLSPWHAAIASGISFLAGAALPLATILLAPLQWRIPVTFAAVLVALALTGGLGAMLGRSPVAPAVIRVVLGGVLALAATWAVGSLLGVSVA
ncbi:VIT family protein [Tessaracoccus sp. OS52]|uniref:VIT1/CCC1 transporter family protein n=1 Tax=Tessaracoccus sp. OS52 TaxID=2886691 RepID=UPI001D10C0F4|nr:VIT family protein [Tessaracoccus sp. OS52]MCC2592912.1 VIT family protein [Tessaracoccus sp. OS52]